MGPTGPSLLAWVSMMVAMMLPGAMPAIARRAREGLGTLAAPRFAGSYLGVWILVAVALGLIYRSPGGAVAGALTIGAGLYELTPLKRECRRRCRERVGSGLRFGVYCLGSSLGLMLVLVAVDVMSPALMVAVAAVVLAQKVFPPRPMVDRFVALSIVALGVAVV